MKIPINVSDSAFDRVCDYLDAQGYRFELLNSGVSVEVTDKADADGLKQRIAALEQTCHVS